LTCQTRQKEILSEAMKMLKPDGEIVYSTCTYSPEEDEEIVAWLVENYPLEIEPLKLYSGMSAGRPEWSKSNLPELKKTGRHWCCEGVRRAQFVGHLKNSEANQEISTKAKKTKNIRQRKSTIPRSNNDETRVVAKVLDNFALPSSLEHCQNEVLQSNGHV